MVDFPNVTHMNIYVQRSRNIHLLLPSKAKNYMPMMLKNLRHRMLACGFNTLYSTLDFVLHFFYLVPHAGTKLDLEC